MQAVPSTPDSALPSVTARVLAFASICLGGLAGGVIGYAFATLQCTEGGCTLSRGLFLWIGSLVGALGTAVIAVLSLRALGEWANRTSTSTR
jgi:ABC-type Co2+ transport system permease subunit